MEMERTKETWTPRPRCVPAHVRQMKVENLGDACGKHISQCDGCDGQRSGLECQEKWSYPLRRWRTTIAALIIAGALLLLNLLEL